MSESRYKHVSKDPARVAQDVVDYILKPFSHMDALRQHQKELYDLMQAVKEEYSTASSTSSIFGYFESWIHKFTRTRAGDIEAIQSTILEADVDQLTMLEYIVAFLKQGGNEDTSSNSRLLDHLIGKLPYYKSLNEDQGYIDASASGADYRKTVRYQLKTAIISNAEKLIEEYRHKAEATRKVIQIEKPVVKKLEISDKFKDRLAAALRPDQDTVALNDFVKEEYDPKIEEEKRRQAMEERKHKRQALRDKFHKLEKILSQGKSETSDHQPVGSLKNDVRTHMLSQVLGGGVSTKLAENVAETASSISVDESQLPDTVSDQVPSPPAMPSWFAHTAKTAVMVDLVMDDQNKYGFSKP